MTDDLQEYRYLWDGSSPNVVLIRSDSQQYLVYDLETRQALIIEDEKESEAVIARMRAAGVRVVVIRNKQFVDAEDEMTGG